MNKYQAIYETLYPDDKLADDDPRKNAIIMEMVGVCNAPTFAAAVKYVDWWNWKSHQEMTSFITRARKLARAK